MKDILDFAGEHYIVALLMFWSLCTVLKMPFWVMNRWFRSRNILKHGWPRPPLDGDGDIVSKS